MKQRSTLNAFIITLTLYASITAIIFWTFDNLIKTAEKRKTLKKVPINISMFQAPAPQPIEPPKIIPPKIIPPNKPKPIKKKKIVKKKKKVVKKKKPKPRPIPKPKPIEKVVEEFYTPPVVVPVVTKVKATPTPPPPRFSASEIASAEDRYKAELTQTIATLAKNNYPRRAKRRRWEGELTLRFVLHRDGSITNLEIIDKARRNILNETAINIIKHKMNMRFKPFFDEIDKEKWTFTQPISFSLKR